jgi:hypothetical protein
MTGSSAFASPSASDAAGQHSVGAQSSLINPIVEVPKEAILDFKLWMKQKQAVTAAAISLVSLPAVPESIAEDEEVCAVNRSVLQTTFGKRPGRLQRPITPTVYDSAARFASMTPSKSLSPHCQVASVASDSKVAWLHAPQQHSASHSTDAPSGKKPARSLKAAGSGSSRTPSQHVSEEIPLLPRSFLPRELDPLEAVRVQEKRQLAALQEQIMKQEQNSRSITPAAFQKLKRRILGAVACADEAASLPAIDGDVLNPNVDVSTASPAFRPKLQSGLRLRRLVLQKCT